MNEIKESLERYVKHKIPCGSFLNAVLENDLMGALGKADYQNQHRLHEICSYVYNDVPSDVWGSPEIVRRHLKGEKSE